MTRPPHEWNSTDIALYSMGKMDMTDAVTAQDVHERIRLIQHEDPDTAQILRSLAADRDAAHATIERLEAENARLSNLDREAATYVESVIITRTRFSGEVPYVGWQGLGLALTEALDERDDLAKALEGVIVAEKSSYFGSDAEKHKRAAKRGAIRKAVAAYRKARGM